MLAHMLLLLAAGDGGFFTVAPSLGLVLWMVFVFLLVVAVVYAVVRLVGRSRRGAGRS